MRMMPGSIDGKIAFYDLYKDDIPHFYLHFRALYMQISLMVFHNHTVSQQIVLH